MLRKAKALVLPFYCDGYDEEIFRQHLRQITAFIAGCDVDVETAPLMKTADEAEAAAEKYNPYLFDFAVLLPVTWSEPRLAAIAARQFFGKPLVVWSIPWFVQGGKSWENSSFTAAEALRGSLQEMGIACEWVSCLPDGTEDPRLQKKIGTLATAARAISLLRNTRIGCFGHNFNGITSAGFDLSVLRRELGTEIYSVDGSELIARMKALSSEDVPYVRAKAMVEEKVCGCMGEKKDDIIRMTAALLSYAEEYGWQAIDLRCHTEFSQTFGLAACLPLSVLGDELICSCEADIPVVLTQLLLHYLAGGKNSTYVDIRTIEEEGMKVGACGYAPCNLCIGNQAQVGGEGGYLTNTACFKAGRLTLARVLKFPGGALALHAVHGSALGQMEPLQEYGCPVYPMTQIVPDVSVDDFVHYLGGNHYALVYEEVLSALELFCRYTGIQLLR